jgi:membrane protease YdiL (CAAX protease family)
MPPLTAIFWNEAEARLRAGWRIGLQLAAYLYGPLLLNRWLGGPLTGWLGRRMPALAPLFEQTVHFLVSAVVIYGVTWAIVRYVDRRPFADMGFHIDGAWWVDLGFGVALGGVLMTAIFLIERLLGWIRVSRALPPPENGLPLLLALLAPLVAFVVISLTEELLSSGYQVRNLSEGLNLRWLDPRVAILLAWIISSVIFAWLHTTNPNSSLTSTGNLFLLGLLFGLGYVLTGSLAIPIGLHFSWNFFQGTVFGYPVSGRSYGGVALLEIEQAGPVRWTGGAFGPEAGLIGLLAMLAGVGLTVWWVWWRTGRAAFYLPLTRYRPLQPSTDLPVTDRTQPQE